MPAPVVVEVYAPQPRPQELSVLLAACTRAATPHECITSDAKSAESPLGVAIVRRDGERARIELGLRGVVSAEWSTRDLVFQPGDDELERYRAIGFAIGTLVARTVEPPSPPPTESKTAPAAPSVTAPPARAPAGEKPAAPPPRRARATWLDVAGGVGLALIPGPPRAGGSLRAATEIVPRGIFGLAETGYAERVNDPTLRVRWLTMAIGIGHPLAPNLRSLGVDVRLQLVVERMALTAYSGAGSAGKTRWKPGVTAAIDGHWDAAPPVGLVLSAATFVDPRRTVVHVGGQPVGETPSLGLSGFIGVRLKLR